MPLYESNGISGRFDINDNSHYTSTWKTVGISIQIDFCHFMAVCDMCGPSAEGCGRASKTRVNKCRFNLEKKSNGVACTCISLRISSDPGEGMKYRTQHFAPILIRKNPVSRMLCMVKCVRVCLPLAAYVYNFVFLLIVLRFECGEYVCIMCEELARLLISSFSSFRRSRCKWKCSQCLMGSVSVFLLESHTRSSAEQCQVDYMLRATNSRTIVMLIYLFATKFIPTASTAIDVARMDVCVCVSVKCADDRQNHNAKVSRTNASSGLVGQQKLPNVISMLIGSLHFCGHHMSAHLLSSWSHIRQPHPCRIM